MQTTPSSAMSRLDHLTFKGNLKETRFGWLRLTPAYSVHLVAELLQKEWQSGSTVLDPFCGTGTTALVCAERGIPCDTTDINPFLLWLAKAKTYAYNSKDLRVAKELAPKVAKAITDATGQVPWTPPLHQIEKWWSNAVLEALGRGMAVIRAIPDDEDTAPAANLLRVAFCRAMISHANVSFGHQSMSFKKKDDSKLLLPLPTSEASLVAETWSRSVASIVTAAESPIRKVPYPVACDARNLRTALPLGRYGCVITSPPYPNRMSYIRELRPYMYWLGYLRDGREAGELDWQAIGGTWGCATSNVGKWKPDVPLVIPYTGFSEIVERITARSGVLGRYVAKYFHDMVGHCQSLFDVTAPGGSVHYIVGNSKFYDVMLPVEHIYAALFEDAGFEAAKVETIRKRTSKKELFEFVVSARKPSQSAN